MLSRTILVAEPWDTGTYQVGNFPVDWSEWNGRFRDTLRRFVKGDGGQLADLGWRLTGSADLYGDDGRSAYNSINFVTCHDGFTLHDLVVLQPQAQRGERRRQPRRLQRQQFLELRRRGRHRRSGGAGAAEQLMKNHACPLLFASGTPMMLGGDEFARTQRGNNNAYCQDNAVSWFDWDAAARNDDLIEFFRKAIAFVRRFPILQQRRFAFAGDIDRDGEPDLRWFAPDLGSPQWNDAGLENAVRGARDRGRGRERKVDACSSSSTPTSRRNG